MESGPEAHDVAIAARGGAASQFFFVLIARRIAQRSPARSYLLYTSLAEILGVYQDDRREQVNRPSRNQNDVDDETGGLEGVGWGCRFVFRKRARPARMRSEKHSADNGDHPQPCRYSGGGLAMSLNSDELAQSNERRMANPKIMVAMPVRTHARRSLISQVIAAPIEVVVGQGPRQPLEQPSRPRCLEQIGGQPMLLKMSGVVESRTFAWACAASAYGQVDATGAERPSTCLLEAAGGWGLRRTHVECRPWRLRRC